VIEDAHPARTEGKRIVHKCYTANFFEQNDISNEAADIPLKKISCHNERIHKFYQLSYERPCDESSEKFSWQKNYHKFHNNNSL
jgi:hypothetical protein